MSSWGHCQKSTPYLGNFWWAWLYSPHIQPFHWTLRFQCEHLPWTQFGKTSIYHCKPHTQGYKHILGFTSDFREAFHHHYFTFLGGEASHSHCHPRESLPFSPQCSDVVLVKDQTAPRGSWPFGLKKSVDKRDGKAFVKRVVLFSALNHPDQNVQTTLKEYTCNRLFPLELADSDQTFPDNLLVRLLEWIFSFLNYVINRTTRRRYFVL